MGNRQHLAVFAGLILHLQDADRPAGDHHAGNQRHRRDDQHVDRVTVTADGLGHVTVVGRVVHRRAHEAVDKYRTGSLVDLVLDRIGIHRDFDDDVEGVGHVFAPGLTLSRDMTWGEFAPLGCSWDIRPCGGSVLTLILLTPVLQPRNHHRFQLQFRRWPIVS
jgi:hypothetical protein